MEKKRLSKTGARVPSEDPTLREVSTLVINVYQQADWLTANAPEISGWLQPEKDNPAVKTVES